MSVHIAQYQARYINGLTDKKARAWCAIALRNSSANDKKFIPQSEPGGMETETHRLPACYAPAERGDTMVSMEGWLDRVQWKRKTHEVSG